MTHAAQVVDRAIGASGLGEPWCCLDDRWPDAVRVGNRLIVVETDDGLGWLITSYALPGNGGTATPVAVVAKDNDDSDHAVQTLTSLIRETGRPMAWNRVKPGLYRAGQYRVGQLDTGEWFAEGPGVDQVYDHKAAAQEACERARGGVSR